MTNLNIGVEHLAFDVNQQHIWATHFSMQTHEISYVTRKVYAITRPLRWKQNVQVKP
jgi:hypothetical protein